ncbi:TPA: phage protein NinX family protein [Serratia marcescens]
MTDYSNMSDFEINVAVSLELFDGSSGGDTSRIATWCACKENGEYGLFDPCNNPADAWPIIVASLIEVSPDYDFTDESEQELSSTGFWTANHVEADGNSYYQSHKNPLRAAMIVFLMMKDAESKN